MKNTATSQQGVPSASRPRRIPKKEEPIELMDFRIITDFKINISLLTKKDLAKYGITIINKKPRSHAFDNTLSMESNQTSQRTTPTVPSPDHEMLDDTQDSIIDDNCNEVVKNGKQCQVCGEKVERDDREDHAIIIHSSYYRYYCSLGDCTFHANLYSSILAHRQQKHSNDIENNFEFVGPTLQEEEEIKNLLVECFGENWKEVEEEQNKIRCGLCGVHIIVPTKRAMTNIRRHAMVHASYRRHACKLCDFKTRQNRFAKSHRSTHKATHEATFMHCMKIVPKTRDDNLELERMMNLCFPELKKDKRILNEHGSNHQEVKQQNPIRSTTPLLSRPTSRSTTATSTNFTQNVKKEAVHDFGKQGRRKQVNPPRSAAKTRVAKKPATKKVKAEVSSSRPRRIVKKEEPPTMGNAAASQENVPSTSRPRRIPKKEEPTVQFLDVEIAVTDFVSDVKIRIPPLTVEDLRRFGINLNQ